MKLIDLFETASAGSTSAGGIASIPTGLWNGPVIGRYPYITPDYKKAGFKKASDLVPRAEPESKSKKRKRKKVEHPTHSRVNEGLVQWIKDINREQTRKRIVSKLSRSWIFDAVHENLPDTPSELMKFLKRERFSRELLQQIGADATQKFGLDFFAKSSDNEPALTSQQLNDLWHLVADMPFDNLPFKYRDPSSSLV